MLITIFNWTLFFSELDIGDDWVDSEGLDESELGDYATENLLAEIVNKAERKQSQPVGFL